MEIHLNGASFARVRRKQIMNPRASLLPAEGTVVQSRALAGMKRTPFTDNEQVSFAALWRILRRRQLSILLCTVLCTLLALAASLYMTTKYEAVATVEVNKENSDMLGLSPIDRVDGGGNADSLAEAVTLETEANALQSSSLAFEVVEQLGLEHRKEFSLQTGAFGDNGRINAELRMPLEQAPLR